MQRKELKSLFNKLNYPEADMLFSVETETNKNHFSFQGICRSVKKKKRRRNPNPNPERRKNLNQNSKKKRVKILNKKP